MYFRSVMFLAIGEFSGLFPGQNWPECENGFAEGSLGPIGGKASRDPPAGRPWSRLLRCRSGNISKLWGALCAPHCKTGISPKLEIPDRN